MKINRLCLFTYKAASLNNSLDKYKAKNRFKTSKVDAKKYS